MKDFILQLFRRGGEYSMTKWVVLWTYLVAVCVPVHVWAIMYFKTDGKADIPTGVVALATLVCGTVTTGDVFKSYNERKVDKGGNPVSVDTQAK